MNPDWGGELVLENHSGHPDIAASGSSSGPRRISRLSLLVSFIAAAFAAWIIIASV
jgi:hypothetical protein